MPFLGYWLCLWLVFAFPLLVLVVMECIQTGEKGKGMAEVMRKDPWMNVGGDWEYIWMNEGGR